MFLRKDKFLLVFNFSEQPCVALVYCIVDDKKFLQAQLSTEQADDLYTNGRKSSTCDMLLENSHFYKGQQMPWVFDSGMCTQT